MVYPALLPLMRTTRLPVADWTNVPRRFKWTRPFRRKTKSGFSACDITFQLASATSGCTAGTEFLLSHVGQSAIVPEYKGHPENDALVKSMSKETGELESCFRAQKLLHCQKCARAVCHVVWARPDSALFPDVPAQTLRNLTELVLVDGLARRHKSLMNTVRTVTKGQHGLDVLRHDVPRFLWKSRGRDFLRKRLCLICGS